MGDGVSFAPALWFRVGGQPGGDSGLAQDTLPLGGAARLGWGEEEEEEGRALLTASQGDSDDALGHQPLPLATSPCMPSLGAGVPTACTPPAP